MVFKFYNYESHQDGKIIMRRLLKGLEEEIENLETAASEWPLKKQL